MTPHLFILSGASGSGKTTLLRDAISGVSACVMAPKYSERQVRTDEPDDIITVASIASSRCDIRYVINGVSYGIVTSEIEELLNGDRHVVVVLSDFRVIRRMKSRFGRRAVTLYVSSMIDPAKLAVIHGRRYQFSPTALQRRELYRQFARLKSAAELDLWTRVFECASEFIADWRDVIPEGRSVEIRAQKIRTFHDRYIENIDLFDHVVLNYHTPDEMQRQFEALAAFHSHANSPVRSAPGLFVVAAASGAGKGTLMQALRRIGSDRVAVVTKMARRQPKPGDAEDGMVAIGDAPFPAGFDLMWRFHKGAKTAGTEYAVSSELIEKNIAGGRHQIVVSNIGQFDMFKQRYSDRAAFVYLHRDQTQEQLEAFQRQKCKTPEEADDRISEAAAVHASYIQHIADFRHVLLNTAYQLPPDS